MYKLNIIIIYIIIYYNIWACRYAYNVPCKVDQIKKGCLHKLDH